MKTLFKLTLTFFAILISLAAIVNLPFVNTGTTQTDCVQGKCSSHEVYQSLMQQYWGCGWFTRCTGNVKTITLEYAVLKSGTASSSDSRGTANLIVGFNNPTSGTKILSFTVPNSNITVFQCTSPYLCETTFSPTIAASGITSFNTTLTAF